MSLVNRKYCRTFYKQIVKNAEKKINLHILYLQNNVSKHQKEMLLHQNPSPKYYY
jgi:hypothetical protein